MDAVLELDEPPEEKNNAAAAAEPALFPPVVPWPAAVAARYERGEKLGRGMFGDVYKAQDRVSGRLVAVKRLSGKTTDDFVATPLPYFEREVLSLEACRGHPSVVQLLGASYGDGDNGGDGDGFIVTEYAGPMNLRKYMDRRLRNGEPFDEDEVREIMEQLLAGARHAHAAGIVHRDMVPENVVVDMDDTTRRMVYKICGFGMSEPSAAAAAQPEDKDDSGRLAGMVYKMCGLGMSEPPPPAAAAVAVKAKAAEEKDDCGMLASPSPYRAPELFLGSKDYDGRVDTWSLGCIMAELVAGDGTTFFGGVPDKDRDIFDEMMDVVGSKGIVEWPGLDRVARRDRAARLRKSFKPGCLKKTLNILRPDVQSPADVLSPAGFKVLKGLLDSSPDSRLSAAAALSKPWFRDNHQRAA